MQDPQDAIADEMPLAGLRAVTADLVAPGERIGDLLSEPVREDAGPVSRQFRERLAPHEPFRPGRAALAHLPAARHAGPRLPGLPFTSVQRTRLPRNTARVPVEPAPDLGDLTRWAEHEMERHTPAFVIIDEDHTVLHFSGPIARHLSPASGAASLELLQLVHPVLRADLRSALERAEESGQPAEEPGLALENNGLRQRVDLTIEPRIDAPGRRKGFLVVFKDCGMRGDAEQPGGEGEGGDGRLSRMDQDLRLTRDRLQATVEKLESTNEELKSSNEEYLSLNEDRARGAAADGA